MLSSPLLTAQPDVINISMINAGIVALLGYVVVFAGLIVLMMVVIAIGKVFTAKSVNSQAVVAAEPAVAETPKAVAPGSAGQLKLHNVEPKTAAMLMAIVADKMGKPLNELRFLSIKEVE